MRLSAGRRGGLATVVMATALALAGPARAHDSQFDGHYTLSGVHWQLNYVTYANSYTSNCGLGYPGYIHNHWVNHNYRQVADQGPYYFYHQNVHYISCTASGQPVRRSGARRQTFQAEVDPDRTALERALCSRFELFCRPGRAGRTAPAATTRLREQVPVALLRLTPAPLSPAPLVGASPTVAARTEQAAPGECVVGVLDRDGMGAPGARELAAGVTLEIATPEVAASLGHPC